MASTRAGARVELGLGDPAGSCAPHDVGALRQRRGRVAGERRTERPLGRAVAQVCAGPRGAAAAWGERAHHARRSNARATCPCSAAATCSARGWQSSGDSSESPWKAWSGSSSVLGHAAVADRMTPMRSSPTRRAQSAPLSKCSHRFCTDRGVQSTKQTRTRCPGAPGARARARSSRRWRCTRAWRQCATEFLGRLPSR
jgi:hypothetical protein